jgi:hypothetical protein
LFDLSDAFEYFEIGHSKILFVADKSNQVLQHAFRNLARIFLNLEFVLAKLPQNKKVFRQ